MINCREAAVRPLLPFDALRTSGSNHCDSCLEFRHDTIAADIVDMGPGITRQVSSRPATVVVCVIDRKIEDVVAFLFEGGAVVAFGKCFV